MLMEDLICEGEGLASVCNQLLIDLIIRPNLCNLQGKCDGIFKKGQTGTYFNAVADRIFIDGKRLVYRTKYINSTINFKLNFDKSRFLKRSIG